MQRADAKSGGFSSIENLGYEIMFVRGRCVLVDSDVAKIYCVETKKLNQQVKRNLAYFPDDSVFKVTGQEFRNLRSQFVTLARSVRTHPPTFFTAEGLEAAASFLRKYRTLEKAQE